MTREKSYRLLYVALDSIAVLIAYFLFNSLRYTIEETGQYWSKLSGYLFNPKALSIGLLQWFFWIVLIWISGYYNRPLNKGRINDIITTAGTVLVAGTIEYLFLVTNDAIHDPSRLLPLYFLLIAIYFVCLYSLRALLTRHCRKRRSDPKFHPRVMIIGTAEEVSRLCSKEKEIRFITCATAILGNDLKVTEEEISRLFFERNPSAIFVAIGKQQHSTSAAPILYSLYQYKVPVYITLESVALSHLSYVPNTALSEPLVEVTATRMSEMEKNIKWTFDKIASILALILLSPLFLVIAIAVRCSSPGNIFYTQERIGKRGKPFRIIKFRTMYEGSEANGPQLSNDNDPRITPIGRTLRRYRLDEIPQFYNVLRGDMSFVGPRPERAYYINQLFDKAPYYYLLHNVLPGITSWGMVQYGYASTPNEMLERLQYDWLYYQNMSLRLDLEILLNTIWVLFKGKGK